MLDGEVTDEWFDVVDDFDRVVDRQRRPDVHRLGLRHRAVHVLVTNAAGEIFLQRRSLRKDTAPGLWDSSASGHLGSGEDYDACALRELQEELGWTPDGPVERLLRLEACAGTGQEFVWVYRTRGEGPFRLHPEEIDDGAWRTPAQIDAMVRVQPGIVATSFGHIWTELRRRRLVD